MANNNNANVSKNDQEYIYVKSFYHRGARKRLYAENYGLKAFRLPVRRRK